MKKQEEEKENCMSPRNLITQISGLHCYLTTQKKLLEWSILYLGCVISLFSYSEHWSAVVEAFDGSLMWSLPVAVATLK
jgi:hypothetical protein